VQYTAQSFIGLPELCPETLAYLLVFTHRIQCNMGRSNVLVNYHDDDIPTDRPPRAANVGPVARHNWRYALPCESKNTPNSTNSKRLHCHDSLSACHCKVCSANGLQLAEGL
jgi:hypothetical protein